MAEDDFSKETMLEGLHDIRLPASAPGGLIAEMAVMIGVAMVCALLVSFLLPVVFRRVKPPVAEPTIADKIAAAAELPETERAIALLQLIRTQKPEAMPVTSAQLYTAYAFPSVAQLEAALLAQPASHD